jgi:hypothetical protein
VQHRRLGQDDRRRDHPLAARSGKHHSASFHLSSSHGPVDDLILLYSAAVLGLVRLYEYAALDQLRVLRFFFEPMGTVISFMRFIMSTALPCLFLRPK